MIDFDTYQSGTLKKSIGYQYFEPSRINDEWKWFKPELNSLLEKAAIKVGELHSFSRFVPNINLFIQLHVTKEAVVSSKIEGTQTEITEALLPQGEVEPEKRDDWKEVDNYIHAMKKAMVHLADLPISGRLLRTAHHRLLQHVRGEHKLPGEFRTSQNWIGGATLKDAMFIPPHHELVPELMSDLEHFLHNDDIKVPDLIRIGIAHYQFETIHPFLDGNGRIGRLLITLYLSDKKILDKPLLYLSAFFEKNKTLYYDNLTRVRTHNDMFRWLSYFLMGIEQTASKAIERLVEILELKKATEQLVQQQAGRRIQSALTLLDQLWQNPYTTAEQAKTATGLSFKAANDLVNMLMEFRILVETTGQSRNRIFLFKQYLDVFRD